MATGSSDRTVRLWDISSGECAHRQAWTYTRPQHAVLCCAVPVSVDFTQEALSLVPACDPTWRPHSVAVPAVLCCAAPVGSCVRVLTSQTSCVTCLGFSPDGQQLAAGTEDGTVAVYDLGSARRYGTACAAVSGKECRGGKKCRQGQGQDAYSRSVRRTKRRDRIHSGKLPSKGGRRKRLQPSCPLPGRQLACRLLRTDLHGCSTRCALTAHTSDLTWPLRYYCMQHLSTHLCCPVRLQNRQPPAGWRCWKGT